MIMKQQLFRTIPVLVLSLSLSDLSLSQSIQMRPSATSQTYLRPTTPSTPSNSTFGVRFQDYEGAVYVREVLPGGSASRLTDQSTRSTVSLEAGDRIISINGTTVRDANSAQYQIDQAVGNISIEIVSKSTSQLRRLSGQSSGTIPDPRFPGSAPNETKRLGITMIPVQILVNGRTNYVVRVTTVEPGSVATRMRDLSTNTLTSIAVGEYIVAINGSSVRDDAMARSLIQSSGGTIRVDVKNKQNQNRSLEGTFANGGTPWPIPAPPPAPIPNKLRFGIRFDNTPNGVQITSVEPNSAATRVIDLNTNKQLYLEPGGYLVSINGVRIQSDQQATVALQTSPKQMILEIRNRWTNEIRTFRANLPY